MKPRATESLAATIPEHRRQMQIPESGVLDYLPDGILICQTLAGNLTVAYANRACAQLLGLTTPGALVGETLARLLGQRISHSATADLQRAVTTARRVVVHLGITDTSVGPRLRLELQPASDNGAGTWVGSLVAEERKVPLQIQRAQLVATAPERSQAATARSTLSPLVREILDATPGLIGVRDTAENFTFVNISMAEFCGRERAEFVGRTWEELRAGEGALALPSLEALSRGRPVVRRNVLIADTLGVARRFDVVHRPLSAGTDRPKYVLTMAVEANDSRWQDAEEGAALSAQPDRDRRLEYPLGWAETSVREVTQAIPGVVGQAYLSPEGKLEFRYLSGSAVTGVSLEAAVKDPRVLLHRVEQDDRAKLLQSLAESAKHLTPWRFDYRTRDLTGELRSVSACAYPRRLPDGGTLFNGIAMDATPRMKAEEALRSSEERFRELYQSTPVMMHSIDARGRIVSANPAWLRTLGYDPSEILGRRTSDFLTRASRQHFDFDDPETLGEDGAQDIPCQMIRKDGALTDVLISARRDRSRQKALGANLCVVDITDRNRVLRALEESEERYRAVVQDQTEVICRFDRSGILQFANAACVRASGTEASQLVGTRWSELIDVAHRERAQTALADISAASPLLQRELRLVGPDNRWFQWTIRGFFDERNELLGYQAVGRDIQELKELEREIREISHREQERIGHDLHDGLGQELTGMSLMLKTLEQASKQQAPELQPKIRSVRDMVNRSIAATRALAQGLSPVHLERDGFAGALSQLATNTDAVHGVPITFRAVRTAPISDRSVTTDLYRIAQEALNNAAKHSMARQITLSLAVDEERIKMEIGDDGCGLRKSRPKNGGMGLKIMRYRASMIGASLDIIPREGGGTIVRCLLRQTPPAGSNGSRYG